MNLDFLKACRGERVSRTPIWLMRQAGRYLPDYQRVRSRGTFLDLCKTPDAACEVTLQPIDILGVDAAIIFADILLPLEGYGVKLQFSDGEGPRIDPPIRRLAQIDQLPRVDPIETTGYVMSAIQLVKKELSGRVPLIGFSGAPFTLACYLVEGGVDKNFIEIKRLLYGDPLTADRLLDALVQLAIDYLAAQVSAGADAVQLFDTWAGQLSVADFRRFVVPGIKQIVTVMHQRFPTLPVIYYVNGAGLVIDEMRETGVDVIGLDWRVDLGEVARRVSDRSLQGNLDPTVLFGSRDEVRRRALKIVEDGRQARGHIFNLGHGVLPRTDPGMARYLVDLVHGDAR